MLSLKKTLKYLISNVRKRQVFKNWSYLTVLQIAQYVLPFITIPYLVRVLGPSNFGLAAIAVSAAQVSAVFIDFGFLLSATKYVSINRAYPKKLSSLVSSVILIRLGIFSVLAALCALTFWLVPQIAEYKTLILCTLTMAASEVIFMVWFFQGLEKMKYIALLNICTELLYVALVFICIKTPQHYVFVPLLSGLVYILSGLAALTIIIKKFKVKFELPKFFRIKFFAKKSWHYFISDFSTNVYIFPALGALLLGTMTSSATVGFYKAAVNILVPLKALFDPLIQAVYPYAAHIAKKSKIKALGFVKPFLVFTATASFIISCFLFFAADFVVYTFLGDMYAGSVILLKIMAFIPFLYTLNLAISLDVLYPFGRKRSFARIASTGMFLGFAFIPFSVIFYAGTAQAISFATLLAELCITVLLIAHIKKTKLYKMFIRS
jgi:PST family polysaccharide transporter